MTDFFTDYGLFLAKAATVLLVVWLIVVFASASSRRGRGAGERLEVRSLNRKFDRMAQILRKEMLPKGEFIKWFRDEKRRKRHTRRKAPGGERRKRVFVLDFHGDIKATAVASLREEITAVLTQATPRDEVVVRLDNAGGLVHEHGLAASQLARIRQKGIPLTAAVDKVAASGGYLMASVANRIVAAPFAVIGSIGVLAQLPNFHRFLDQHGVRFELVKAGQLKRTLTMFGENTEEDRAKMKEQLDDTHQLFKDFVAGNRPDVDIEQVATGEYWHGTRALNLKLIDDLMTSDDYLIAASEGADVYQVRFEARKRISERAISAIESALDRLGL